MARHHHAVTTVRDESISSPSRDYVAAMTEQRFQTPSAA